MIAMIQLKGIKLSRSFVWDYVRPVIASESDFRLKYPFKYKHIHNLLRIKLEKRA